jgi:hypothetical protein
MHYETYLNLTELLGFWTFPSSDILENTIFRKLDLFPSSGKGGEKIPTQLGLLESASQSLDNLCQIYTAIYSSETRLLQREITRNYTIKIAM